MSELSNVLTLVISSFLPWFIPNGDPMLNFHMGLLLSQLIQSGFGTIRPYFSFLSNFWRQNEVIIYNRADEEEHHHNGNQLYAQLEDYLMSKYLNEIKTCELRSKRGDVSLSINNSLPLTFNVTTEDGTIRVRIGSGTDKEGSRRKCIVFTSSLSVTKIQDYVKTIASQKIYNNVITIYRSLQIPYEKSEKERNLQTFDVEWDTIYIKTNKTRTNTIYSDKINKELFDDMEWFIKHEDWFAERGIPYKRGYLLHGLPGTGKTSVAKILANMYEMPVFVLDLSTIGTNGNLIKLATEINYHARNKRYIILMEDLDRSSIFDMDDDNYGRRRRDVEAPTIDCMLNFLDGVVETHGRVCIVTANDKSKLDICPAMFRPGRIDRTLEFSYCTVEQIMQLCRVFYGEESVVGALEQLNITEDAVKQQLENTRITPAELMKLLQTRPAMTIEDGIIACQTLIEEISSHTTSHVSIDDNEAGILGALEQQYTNYRHKRFRKNNLSRRVTTALQAYRKGEKAVATLEKLKDRIDDAKEKAQQELARDLKRIEKENSRKKSRKQTSNAATEVELPVVGKSYNLRPRRSPAFSR